MMNIVMKILLLGFLTILHANRFPENGETFNHVQIFFRWEQIPHAINHELSIQNLDTEEWFDVMTESNSHLMTEFIDWNSTFAWFACGHFEDGSAPLCNQVQEFTINPLPDYFPNEINILSHDESLYQEGITVMDFESQNCSGALDENGRPLLFIQKEDFQERFVFTQFLKNGNMVGFGPGKGYEINLDGNIVFETPDAMSVHHDFNKTSKDTYFLISATIQNQYCPEECNSSLPDEIPWQGDIFREFDKHGNEIWSWNAFDYYDLSEYNPYYVEIYNGWNPMDWTHSNSVSFDENSESVIVSARNLSRITKIDYSSKELVWNMGEADYMNETYFQEDHNFSQQHSVQVLDNGNLLFFDNHRYLSPELSRCLEIAYDETNQTSEITWEHVLPMELFSGSRGECDRLENGNTLITAGRTGNTIEVTPNNELAWHLEVKNSNLKITMYRSSRIPNLHPVAFSLSIDELTGDFMNPQVELDNGNMTLNIHNHGWSEGWYVHSINDHVDSSYVHPFEDAVINLDLNDLGIQESPNLLVKVFPTHATEKVQTLEITQASSGLLGDMNEDGLINVLDIVILATLILDGDETDLTGDLNQDGIQNVLDIVLLINTILGNQ